MNSERLNLLVNELRRGEFIQGTGCLRRPDNHCPLGVACEVFRRHTGRGRWLPFGRRYRFVASAEGRPYGLWRQAAMPAPEVVRWYLHDPEDPRVEQELNLLFRQVAARNDNGVPFEELARMIEAFVAEEEGGCLAGVGEVWRRAPVPLGTGALSSAIPRSPFSGAPGRASAPRPPSCR